MPTMKRTSKQAQDAARVALQYGNPYKAEATAYQIGTETRYIWHDGKTYTDAELDAEYMKTAAADYAAGYNDRRAGYLDKWYRYNHSDGGRAYDAGQRAAADLATTPAELHIIPA